MSSYVIAGASRGLGYEFVRQLSSDPKNTVIGLVRDVPGVKEKVSTDFSDRKNIHIFAGDLTNLSQIKAAASETASITGGSLDYLIANGAYISTVDAYAPIGFISPEDLSETLIKSIETNVIGNVNLYNAFIPLILKGNAKKVINISTGMADTEFNNELDIEVGALYATSKAAMNVMVSKFSAQYKKQGVLFLAISPGVVDTGHLDMSQLSPEQLQGLQAMMVGFQKYAPDFKGPISPEESVKKVVKVWEDASIEKGLGGGFISHLGTKRWL